MNNQAIPPHPAHAIGLEDAFLRLWRRRFVVAAFTAAGIIGALLICATQQRTYRATALVEVQAVNDNLLNTRDVDPTASSLPFAIDAYLQTQIKIVQSESLIANVVDRLRMTDHPEMMQTESWMSRVSRMLGRTPATRKPQREDFTEWARNRLAVHVPAQTGMFEIAFEGPDPKFAAEFVNAVVDQFIESRMENRSLSGQRTSTWLNAQISDLRGKVQRSEEAMQAYARATGLLFTSEKDNTAEQRLRQLQESLSRAHEARIVQQSKYELVNSAPVDSLPEVLDDQVLRDYQTRLTDLRRQFAEFRPVLAPGHFKVQQIQSQITELEGALERKRQNVLSRMRNEYDAAQRQEKILEDNYNVQAQLVSEQSVKAVQYDVLKRELDADRQMYEAILQKVKEVGIASAMRASNISVVDTAKPPRDPFRPKRTAYASVGFGFGLFTGALFALFPRRRWKGDPTSDIGRQLGLPELGSIPLVPNNGANHFMGVVWGALKSAEVTESFRATMVSVLLGSRGSHNGQPPRLIVVSSCSRGDGRSTIAANLAVSFTEANHEVLLVDADVRNPNLHNLLGMTNTHGLTNILSGTKPLDDYGPGELAQESGIPGLHLLASGPTAAVAAGLLHSERMTELLVKVSAKFDIVIIDTPPVLSFSDARTLAKLSDGVAFVTRAGKTDADDVLNAMQRFSEDGTPVLGMIANGRERSRNALADLNDGFKRPESRGLISSTAGPEA